MNKIAKQLESQDSAAAAAAAALKAVEVGQIWDGDGYTKYTFDDNSMLIQSGTLQYAMDADDAESINGYREWLGVDAHLDQKEIDRLLEAVPEKLPG